MGQGQAVTASSISDFAPRTIGLSTIVAFSSYRFLLVHTDLIHGDAAQNASQAIRGSEDNVVGLALKQRRPPARHALIQQLAMLLRRAQLRTAQLAYSLFVHAPHTRTYEIGGASHVETDETLVLSVLHLFCIRQ